MVKFTAQGYLNIEKRISMNSYETNDSNWKLQVHFNNKKITTRAYWIKPFFYKECGDAGNISLLFFCLINFTRCTKSAFGKYTCRYYSYGVR